MIVLTGAFVNVDDHVCFVNPLHIVCVKGVSTAPWQQFDNIQNAYPGARAEITVSTGHPVFVLETPTEVYEKINAQPRPGGLGGLVYALPSLGL